MKKTRKSFYSIIVWIIIFLVLCGLVGFMFFMIKKTNEHISALSHDIDKHQEDALRLTKVNSEKVDVKNNIEKINSYLVDKEGSVSFIESVEREAKKDNVDLAISSVGNEKFAEGDSDSATKEFIHLNVEIQGDWASVTYFTSYLEHLPYKVKLVQATYSQIGETKNKKPLWSGTIEIMVLKHK